MKFFIAIFRCLPLIFTLGTLSAESSKLDSNSKPKDKFDLHAPQTIVFAGGCFWCLQPPFDELMGGKGVLATRVGYAGGSAANPSYEQVSSGKSGHLEVMQVIYDPSKITLAKLLDVFWRNIDPFDAKGQFCDKGEQYTSAIFFSSPEEKIEIEHSIERLKKAGFATDKIVTKILPSKPFYSAEEYHQDYYKKNPIRYKYYRLRCGRDARLKEVWEKIK